VRALEATFLIILFAPVGCGGGRESSSQPTVATIDLEELSATLSEVEWRGKLAPMDGRTVRIVGCVRSVQTDSDPNSYFMLDCDRGSPAKRAEIRFPLSRWLVVRFRRPFLAPDIREEVMAEGTLKLVPVWYGQVLVAWGSLEDAVVVRSK
jgi:hypothetical protein